MFKSYNFISFSALFSLSLSLSIYLLCTTHSRCLMHIPDMSINFCCLEAGRQTGSRQACMQVKVFDNRDTRWFLNKMLSLKCVCVHQKVSLTQKCAQNGWKRSVDEHVHCSFFVSKDVFQQKKNYPKNNDTHSFKRIRITHLTTKTSFSTLCNRAQNLFW